MNQSDKFVFSSVWLHSQPDFAKQSQCKPNAERRELALKSYAEVQPDFVTQRYSTTIPKSKFFSHLISHLESFPHPQRRIQPFIYGHSGVFSTRPQKMKSGYTILPHADSQNVRRSNVWPPPNAANLPLFATAHPPKKCYRFLIVHMYESMQHKKLPIR